MNFEVTVCRDCDAKKLRKVSIVLEVLLVDGKRFCVDRCRMFAGPFFARRLRKKIKRMVKRANVMLTCTK